MPQVKPEEIDPCVGPKGEGCGSNIPVRIKGWDNKWRCPRCNDIHQELVYNDAKAQMDMRK